MADPVPHLSELAWHACTADCQRLGVRSTPCLDCMGATARVVVRLTACDALPFVAARQILGDTQGPAGVPA